MPPHPVTASLLVLTALAAVVLVAKAGSSRWNWNPELPRKFIHVGMGLICLGFPWLFVDPLPVQILSGVAFLFLLALRIVPALRNSIGTTLHGVSRSSVGDLAFPAAVGLIFTFAHDQPVYYLIPILLLTIADAAGALAGLHYGKTRYSTAEGFKSVEGSLSFVFLAFLCVHLPLLLGTETGRLSCVLIALTLALLTMMAEGISTRGTDNFVIPVGGFFLLDILLDLSPEFLAWRLGALLFLLALVTVARRWSTLQGSALLAAVLLGYGCFALGDWRFVLPPAGLFLSHLVTTHRLGIAKNLTHGVDAIGSLGISAFPWLLAKAGGLIDPVLALFAFAGSFATHLAIMHCSTDFWSGKRIPGLLAGTAKGFVLAFLPVLVIELVDFDSPDFRTLIGLPPLLAPILLATAAYNETRRRSGSQDRPIWFTEALLALISSFAIFGILSLPYYA